MLKWKINSPRVFPAVNLIYNKQNCNLLAWLLTSSQYSVQIHWKKYMERNERSTSEAMVYKISSEKRVQLTVITVAKWKQVRDNVILWGWACQQGESRSRNKRDKLKGQNEGLTTLHYSYTEAELQRRFCCSFIVWSVTEQKTRVWVFWLKGKLSKEKWTPKVCRLWTMALKW